MSGLILILVVVALSAPLAWLARRRLIAERIRLLPMPEAIAAAMQRLAAALAATGQSAAEMGIASGRVAAAMKAATPTAAEFLAAASRRSS